EPFGPFETASGGAKGSGETEPETAKPFGLEQGKPFVLASDGAKGSEETEKPFAKPFERETVPEAKGSKGSKGFPEEKANEVSKALGMNVEEVIAAWTAEGKPVINLGPGENCFGLEKLLSNRDINERHLAAVREWLEKRQR
ncbi:MAG: hypothetical protein Q7R57_00175, partial [Dehalococcoidales bacterium]|nr:hypothetical protein [Dehalococcoidales bacterium]